MGCFLCRNKDAKYSTQPQNDQPELIEIGMRAEDCQIIKRSWDEVVDSVALGQAIFRRIFEHQPKLRKSFGFNQEMPIAELIKTSTFIKHANNFTQFLEQVVENINDPKAVLRAASKIGRKHAELQLGKTAETIFDPNYWMYFSSAAVEEITHNVSSRIIMTSGPLITESMLRTAWCMLLLRVILEMKISFYQELILDLRSQFDNGI